MNVVRFCNKVWRIKHSTSQSETPEAKVALFKQYFRGREDVYPFRWESKQGKPDTAFLCQ